MAKREIETTWCYTDEIKTLDTLLYDLIIPVIQMTEPCP